MERASGRRVALFWYLSANESSDGINVDVGTILAQTVLERLAWAYCVEHQRMVSRVAFSPKGLSARVKLRMLITTLGIPAELPTTMRALNAQRGKKWVDIPDAITSIRNVCLSPHKDSLPIDSHREAWRLSMWLLDSGTAPSLQPQRTLQESLSQHEVRGAGGKSPLGKVGCPAIFGGTGIAERKSLIFQN